VTTDRPPDSIVVISMQSRDLEEEKMWRDSEAVESLRSNNLNNNGNGNGSQAHELTQEQTTVRSNKNRRHPRQQRRKEG